MTVARAPRGRHSTKPESGEAKQRWQSDWDVVVIGGGNAALVAAISARERGASVLVLERAAQDDRGGNTRHTRNVRCTHADGQRFSPGTYLYDEMWRDLCSVGSGPTNERLAALTVSHSDDLPEWMSRHGIRWQAALRGTLQLARTNRFFLGGGKALLNRYVRTAVEAGIIVEYEACVESLHLEDDVCVGLTVASGGVSHELSARAYVCASGGYEANVEWLARSWGSAASNFHIRGPRYNDGRVLQALYKGGAKSAGDARGFHAVAVDARSPRLNGGIATRVDAIPLGVVVNARGERFYDEGEDLWPKRYATWGRIIAEQENQISYCIYDQKVVGSCVPPLYPPISAGSIGELAGHLGLDPRTLTSTVDAFNAAVPQGRRIDASCLDGSSTKGLVPAKSNWAQRLDAPPYLALPLRPGITFTYRGVAVDKAARVLREDGEAFGNLFAAGEIMSGNILSTGYLAGFGMTVGSVWGRIAGEHAAWVARRPVARGGEPPFV